MNNALPTSSQPGYTQGNAVFNNNGPIPLAEEEETGAATTTNSDEGNGPEQRTRRLRREKKIAFLDHLIRNFDMVVYCQIWILYYMDLSFFCLLIRAFFHLVLLTPKRPLPPPFPPFPRSPPPSVAIILLTNSLPLLLHTFTQPPSASEAARGYLHGGIVIDFVGQKAPVSKFRLVTLDLLMLVLQVVMMALVLKRRGLEIRPAGDAGHPSTSSSSSAAPRMQNLDAEERGISPDDGEADGPLSSSSNNRHDRRDPISPQLHHDDPDHHPLDAFHSGQYMVANIHLATMLRREFTRYMEE